MDKYVSDKNLQRFYNNLKVILAGIDPLPEVTSADEGKFMRVNSNGEWVAEALPDAEDLEV